MCGAAYYLVFSNAGFRYSCVESYSRALIEKYGMPFSALTPDGFAYSYRIIRRRVIWLIGNWISVKVSGPCRPLIYTSVLTLLQPHEDLVVRLEAALTLKAGLFVFARLTH